ncbi:MAG: hypothetical protein IJA89_05410 [Clostridia bacterium]|nr:hypothetical protein [Clostridia bacterium]
MKKEYQTPFLTQTVWAQDIIVNSGDKEAVGSYTYDWFFKDSQGGEE